MGLTAHLVRQPRVGIDLEEVALVVDDCRTLGCVPVVLHQPVLKGIKDEGQGPATQRCTGAVCKPQPPRAHGKHTAYSCP